MGVGRASGKNAVETALHKAISSPLVDTKIAGGTSILVNFTGDSKLIGIHEVNKNMKDLKGSLADEVDVFFGISIDERLQDEVLVTVITTGLDEQFERKMDPKPIPQPVQQTTNTNVNTTMTNVETVQPNFDDDEMPIIEPAIEREQVQRDYNPQRQPQKRPVFEIPDVFRTTKR